MRFLLDTHALLWSLIDPQRLSASTRKKLWSQQNEVFVSSVSAWEISAKRARGKLRSPDNLEARIEEQNFTPLLLTFSHAEQAGLLPLHHRDPFDRMLVAQAQIENLVIVTNDGQIPRYDVRTIAV